MRSLARIGALAAVAVTAVTISATPVSAHGIGGRADLPVPVSFFVVSAGIAIVVSFLALAVLWPEARLQTQMKGRPLRGRGFAPVVLVLRLVGLAGLLLVVLTGIINTEGGRTISPVLVWVYFWLVVPFLAVVLGNWWLALSPWRALASGINSDVRERPERAAVLGIWPATVAFLGFTWLELISNTSTEPRTLAIAAIAYSLYLLSVTRWLGVQTGLASAGAFENYNRVISAISPLDWTTGDEDESGPPKRVKYRGWLRGLAGLEAAPGLTFLVIAMIGTVTYDGMSGTGWWEDLAGTRRGDVWFDTLAFSSTVLVIGGAYWVASFVASRMAGRQATAPAVARAFAHTLVPIAFVYAFAHYFSLVLVEGQTLLHAASDPFGLGWNLFGTATWRISWVPPPEVVWYTQVAAIVAGHIVGVTLAHDRALHEFGGRVAVRTQYAMLVLMVALTSLGLLILSG